MKIALVILESDPKRGGAERYTVDLAAALGRRGHAVTLVDSAHLGVSGMTRSARYAHFLDRLDDHLATNQYDIIHAMLPVRRCDLYHPHAGMAAEAMSKWNVLFNPRRRAMAGVEQKLMAGEHPPVVLALSEYSKRDVLACYPQLPVDRLATLFNAVDLDRFQPMREPHQGVVALMIANDFERKGLAQTLMALAKVGSSNLKLNVVGKEPPGKHEAAAKDLNVADAVAFLGAVSDPRPFYAGADFFVLPTRHDPCSLVVLEALAMCLPVISTKFNGACEIMTDGMHGYVLDDPDDIDALADAMRKMLDPQRWAEMSAACIALRPRLSYEHHLDQLEAVYREVLSRGTGASPVQ